MTPLELFQDGRLRNAIAAQREVVIQRPDDATERLQLAHFLLFQGGIAEARDLLEGMNRDRSDLGEYLRTYQKLIDAELKRQRQTQPAFLIAPPEHVSYRVEACESLMECAFDRATEKLDEAEACRTPIAGHVDGREFDDARDTDELFGSTLEVLLDDQYVWFPFEQIRRLKIGAIETLRDRYFVPAMLTATTGEEWAVHLPALYIDSHSSEDEDIAVGQATDWIAEPDGPTRGIGLRVLVFGEEELTLFDFTLWEG